MKTCSNCNNENELDVDFCTHCGQPFAKSSSLISDGDTSTGNDVQNNNQPLDLFVGKKSDYYNKKWHKAASKNGFSLNVAAFFLCYRKSINLSFYSL